jgi:hypothetical protein
MTRPALLAALVVLALVAACGGGSPTSTSPFVPDLDNLWQDTKDQTHTFSFRVASPGKESSTFSGNEELNTVESLLSGSFAGRSIQLTIQRASGAAAFSGQFTSKDRIELGTLTLCRALTGPCS